MTQDLNQSGTLASTSGFYLDDGVTVICTYLLYSVICQIFNVFGIVTNIINIICFIKQGFKDSTNISLLGLSVSDLGALLMMFGMCVLFMPAIVDADIPFESTEILYLIFAMPHFAFTRVSGCITALISVERCLSIVAPLQVKHIVTPHRTVICIICIFLVLTMSATPLYLVNKLGSKFSSSRNRTIVGLIFREDKEKVELFTFAINNFFIPFCSFIIVVVCTTILASHLCSNSEWRKTINNAQARKVSSRNKKVAKMVVAISTLFIACFVPISIIVLALAFVPEMTINGKYFNATKILGGFTLILESVNSSVNIFIYHHMSTKYRDTFRAMFMKQKRLLVK